jgi:hypothetical protein
MFGAGFLAAVFLYYLIVAPRTAPQPAASIPNLVVTQFETGGPILVNLPLLRQPSSSILGSGFLFDGVRPQDLRRMNPPRNIPGFTPLPPPVLPPASAPPSDLRQ